MKLSNKVKKCLWEEFIEGREIIFMVDCKTVFKTTLWRAANIYHDGLLAEGKKYLKQESPVFNGNNQIILHYTSTNYKEWCNS